MPNRPKKTKTTRNSMQTIFTRFMLVVAVFIMWIGGISVRLVHLQVNQNQWLRQRALNQRRDLVKDQQLRGTIYDRSERALAMSVKVESLYADPSEIEDVEATAGKLANALERPRQEILEILREGLEKNKRFVWIERKVDDERVRRINAVLEDKEIKKSDLPRLAGLHWQDEERRSYPYKTLAAQVIGFSNSDNIGQAGIEQSKEAILKGEVVKTWQERDRLGRVYEESQTERESPRDIVLTISNSIQFKTEQALEKGVKAANAKSGMAVVLDPKTGEILAMANYPTFDPNKFNEVEPQVWKNKAVQDVYSPGSVFKAIGYGGALNEKLIGPEGEFDGRRGFIKVGGRRFDDPHAMRVMTFTDALAVSSNYAAIKTALGLGKERFYNYARKFGFGAETGVELPAEASGVLHSPETWNPDSLASMAIGYEVSVTALQAAAAYGAVANRGIRVNPHIIKEIRQSDGKVIAAPQPESSEVLSEQTARSLRQMLQRVVLKGTARKAQLNGYTSAGKTGTAWKYDPATKTYNPSKYISSFVGFAPAENPSIVIAVVLDEPRGGGRDGGQVAAPVFREIAEQVLPELRVVPDGFLPVKDKAAEDQLATVDGDDFPTKDADGAADETDQDSATVAEKPVSGKSRTTPAKEGGKDQTVKGPPTEVRKPVKGPPGGTPKSAAPKKKPIDERSKNQT